MQQASGAQIRNPQSALPNPQFQMPRLIRIAATLFVSATILAVLARMRLAEVQGLDPEVFGERIAGETQMSVFGIVLAGLLALGGFVVLGVAFVRQRRERDRLP